MEKTAVVFMDYDNIWITCETNYKINVFDKKFIDLVKDLLIWSKIF